MVCMYIRGGASSSNPISSPDTSNLEELSPRDLVDLSQKHLAESNVARSEEVLKMALSKDPKYLHGLMAKSSLLILKGHFAEALKFLDRVILKPCPEHPLDFSTARIVAPQLAATCCKNLGKPNEAIEYLEPLASMKVPENAIAYYNYYEGLAMLEGMSFEVGRKDIAAKYEMIWFAKAGPVGYARRIANMRPEQKELIKNLNMFG